MEIENKRWFAFLCSSSLRVVCRVRSRVSAQTKFPKLFLISSIQFDDVDDQSDYFDFDFYRLSWPMPCLSIS